MEYDLTKKSVSSCESFLDTVGEQLVDIDLTLPDYCPDIEKILKCTLVPKIYSKNISGGQLTISGASVVRVLYCDSIRNNIRCCEQTVEFSAAFGLKSTPEQYVVLANTKTEYINCRALSPRKLVIHGAFSLRANVISKSTLDFYSLDDECDLQTKPQSISVCDLTALCQEQFSVTEDITVTDKPPVESILNYDVKAYITECKTIHGKIMLSGEVSLKLMYLSDLDTGNAEHISYVFPINQIIDCAGVEEDSINSVSLDVMSYDLRVRNDAMNDGSALSLDVKLCFTEMGYSRYDTSVIDDVYSTMYMTSCNRTPMNAVSDVSVMNSTYIDKSTITVENTKIAKVIDIYNEYLTVSPMISDSKLTLSGKANICMLIADEDNNPSYVERTIEFDYIPDSNKEFSRVDMAKGDVVSISYRLGDDTTVELRTEVKLSTVACDTMSLSPVTSVTKLDDKPVVKDGCSLVLCYAQKGEKLWDIAKSYSTEISSLLEENPLDSETLDEDTMLLIPAG